MKFSGYRELLTNDGKQEESEEGEKGAGQVISSSVSGSRVLSRDAGDVATRLIDVQFEAAMSTSTKQTGSPWKVFKLLYKSQCHLRV